MIRPRSRRLTVPPGAHLVVADARGANRVTLLQEGSADPSDGSVSTSHVAGRARAAVAAVEDHDAVVVVRGYDARG